MQAHRHPLSFIQFSVFAAGLGDRPRRALTRTIRGGTGEGEPTAVDPLHVTRSLDPLPVVSLNPSGT
jgi:hypothetical protein